MRCSPSMISKLGRVRDVRARLAELALARTDQEVAACKQAEGQAREELAISAERCVAETKQADDALLKHKAGGRQGISEWQAARKRAQFALRMSQGKVDDAVSARLGKELERTTAHNAWRDARFDTERLRLLVERLAENAE